ncbi:MAG TPA: PAS domain S-box protein [Gemmatimonadaceae bacterium]|nr:PAS domain S-box protein [Gemmatimonadaceae bacterium]
MSSSGSSELKGTDRRRRDGERRKAQRATAEPDFWAVFESAPDAYLLLAPDSPRFTMVAANECRLRVTMTRREDIIGRALFDVFPDNPNDPAATGVRNLHASLERVLATGKPDRMPLQKYDIRKPDGSFEERYWDPLNSPVFDARGDLVYIIHRVEDVTDQVLSERRARENETTLGRLRESEERYRLLADLIPQHIWTTDPRGYHGYFSRRWYDFTGATLEDTKGEGWLRFLHPDDLERTRARWEHSLRTGERYSIEYRFRRADGVYCWFLGQAVPLRDETGNIVEWFGTLTDISEHKQRDDEHAALLAREQEARRQVTTILESITEAFFAVDREWRFTYVNREAERLLQRRREELIGQSLWNEFSNAVGTIFYDQYHQALAGQAAVEFQAFYPPLEIWVDVHAYPSGDGLSVFFRDVTARRRAEEQLRESEERFRALAENATVAIFVIDDKSRIEFANPAVERIFGHPVQEMLGQSLAMIIPKDQRAQHHHGVDRYLKTGKRNIRWEGIELPGLTKDGRVVPLEISMGEFVRGGRHYFTGIARDVTDRRQAMDALQESERRFRTLGNSIPQLAWMANAAGDIFWYNDRWYEYTGTTFEEMQGWGWTKVHHPEHVRGVVHRIRKAFETGEPWEDTFPLQSRSGEYRWFLSRAVPIHDSAGNVVRWFGTNTDVTEEIEASAERERLLAREREARAEAERRREELERVTESRTRLMRGFTHDVKNPLGAADGHAQLLEEGILGELAPKQMDSVRRIRRSVHRSLHLINELMELARAEAGQINLDRVPTDVAALVREGAEDFRAQATAAGLQLDIRAEGSLHALTDPARVRQILSNLLSNAVKYTPEGGITVEAVERRERRGARGGDCIAITVTDTGPGIPAEKQELIFQEFTRLDPDSQQGAGVGLAISRRIARILGGDITVRSPTGDRGASGSSFTLWIPRETNNGTTTRPEAGTS